MFGWGRQERWVEGRRVRVWCVCTPWGEHLCQALDEPTARETAILMTELRA
jgi:hypothetical protein